MSSETRYVELRSGSVRLLDQTVLPQREEWLECQTVEEVARAISEMRVRGAPAIGLTAAFGIALAAAQAQCASAEELLTVVQEAGRVLRDTRPTAVNLAWAIERMQARARAVQSLSIDAAAAALAREACQMAEEDEAANRRMSQLGQALLPERVSVLTHCNAGALATGGYGTALGVIRAAHETGKEIHVFVDETRPFLQGARLTAWELQQWGVPFTLICDNMAGHFMRQGQVDAVIVGADRIAANGDVANKIGTYSLAVLAFAHRIPFYSVAPTPTLDLATPDGGAIPIEERDPQGVTHLQGAAIAPEGTPARNPAFDVTPHRYLTAIITERGIAYPPYGDTLRQLLEEV
jgi:methylthioribose-1-phosphate isomerase